MRLDYDQMAPTYGARYDDDPYPEIERAMLDLVDCDDLLEVGCGTGHWLTRLAGPQRRLFGVDPSMGMLRHAEVDLRGRRIVGGVAEALPFAAGRFDGVFAIHALHHFQDIEAFGREAARVLRPGGRVVTVGLDPSAGLDQWYIYDFFPGTLERDLSRYPSTARIRAALTAAGFDRISTSVAQHRSVRELARDHLESPAFHRHCASQLALLSDAEFDAGVTRIGNAIRAGDEDGSPAVLTRDLRLYLTTGRLR
jgi:SAM-dependent methyltransferase